MEGVPQADRHQWAMSMGWVIYSVNEIDFQLIFVYGVLTGQELPISLPNNWNKKTTDERVKVIGTLAEELPPSPAVSRIINMCKQIKSLLDKRNHIAHGVLALVGGGHMKMIKYDKSGQVHEMDYRQILQARETANIICEGINILTLHCRKPEFRAPYKPGEDINTWMITPKDQFASDQ